METVWTVVFREKEGGGNPCPVTLEADELIGEQMQEMARKFGVECAFLMRPSRRDCDVKARYYVPNHEMEMCIHATIGSTAVLVERGLISKSPIVFETFYGPVSVEWERVDGQIQVGVYQFLPTFQVPETDDLRVEVCRALNIPQEELGDGPIESVATSREKLIVPLKHKKALYALAPDFEYLWKLCDRYGTTGFYPFVQESDETGEEDGIFYARQFPKRAGYNEDPATGVAASALGAYLTRQKLERPAQGDGPIRTVNNAVCEGWQTFVIKQGEAMGRPSVLLSDCFVKHGRITRTRVRGSAEIIER